MSATNEQAALPRYYVTAAPLGDHITWRVVREDTGPRGMKTLSFICGYPTRRAAVAIARALGTYRNGSSDIDVDHTVPAGPTAHGAADASAAFPALVRPPC